MNKSLLVKINFIFILLACIFTMAMEIYSARPWGDNYAFTQFDDYLTLAKMMLWSISIYLTFAILLFILSRKMILIKTVTIGIFIISLLSCFIIFDITFIHIDAQGGLVYLFLPFYQWFALFVLLCVCAIVFMFSSKKSLNKPLAPDA